MVLLLRWLESTELRGSGQFLCQTSYEAPRPFGSPMGLPETNSKFAPENGWDWKTILVSFLGPVRQFSGAKLLNFTGGFVCFFFKCFIFDFVFFSLGGSLLRGEMRV